MITYDDVGGALVLVPLGLWLVHMMGSRKGEPWQFHLTKWFVGLISVNAAIVLGFAVLGEQPPQQPFNFMAVGYYVFTIGMFTGMALYFRLK